MSKHPASLRQHKNSKPRRPGKLNRRRKSGFANNYQLLEQRELLATLTVNSIADNTVVDGMVTLREAIMAAETNTAVGDATAGDVDGDIIQFDSSLNGQTILLTGGEFSITDDVAIQAAGSNLTIDAALGSRIFNIATTETVIVRGLDLVNGSVMDEGGAVKTTGMGTTVLNGLEISSSVAADGGGVYLANGQLMLLNSSVSGNAAVGGSGSGGGLFIESGQSSVVRTQFTANVANRAGGAIEIVDGRLIFHDSVMGGANLADGNIAGPTGMAMPGNGGGLHVTGMSGTEVFIVGDSLIQNNVAASEGGGLWNQAGSTLVVNNSQVLDNVASGDAADNGGGGIFNNGGRLFISGTAINGNLADGMSGSGGGILSTDGIAVVRNSQLQSNVANRAGGGIEIIDGDLLVFHSILGGPSVAEGNIAGPAGSAAPGNGGGLHVTGTSGTSSYFFETDVRNNFAAREGGGLWNQSGSSLVVVASDMVSNVASGGAADDGGGGIFNNGGAVSVVDSRLESNVADGMSGSGGGIFSTDGMVTVTASTLSDNVANRAGGGLEIVDGTLIFKDSQLSGNIAGPAGSASPGNGGGLHVSGTSGTFTVFVNSHVVNNFAAREGGGLWNQTGSTMSVRENSIIRENTAAGDAADDGGGGIFNNGGNLNVLDSLIAENFANGAAGSGGGIFSTDGTVFINGSLISENSAQRAGGGIEVIDGTVILQNSLLGGLSASGGNQVGTSGLATPGNGGGLHVTGSNGTQTIIDNTIVSHNSAANEGGGLWNQSGSSLVVRNGSTVTQNHAGPSGGGGILNRGGSLVVRDSTVNRNTTTGDGGGLLNLSGSTARILDSEFARNHADGNGGGFYNASELEVDGSSIVFNEATIDGGGIFTEVGATTTVGNTVVGQNTPNYTN